MYSWCKGNYVRDASILHWWNMGGGLRLEMTSWTVSDETATAVAVKVVAAVAA